ncbi:helix-turn-helix transcriptional regulator [Paenibacillus sp. PR3]|uniref:Helix-turn-helix transcriptional regulator n=1 Tax=Paenibacillus terricola TaxID=2763503 RepID=A0ABR8MRY2_9BACL|nr:AraC family transcriptional regulator [Paenibacillus terricola]MBD3917595.1 helix-turn-helix transcriptional regulator [Paenibacillus terricola]
MDTDIALHCDRILRVQDLGFHSISQLYAHPDRRLDWDVFLYVTEGEMQVREEDREYVVKPAQFLFLRSGLHHWGERLTPAGTSWYWIHFYSHAVTDGDPHEDDSLDSYHSYSISSDEYDKRFKLPKHGTILNPTMLKIRLDASLERFRSKDPFRGISLALQVTELFLDLYREQRAARTLTKSDRTVQRIMDYLEQKEGYSLHSEEISASLAMNYSYLCEVFRTKTGSTIQSYNARIVMDKAVRLMRESNLNISEISETLGFRNPFYFSRVFRKVIGCSPSEYRGALYLNPF